MAKKQTNSDEIKRTVKRLAIFAGGLFVLSLIIMAVENKVNSRVGFDVNINIVKIDGKEFITKEDVNRIIRDSAQQRLENASVGKLNVPLIEKSLRNDHRVLNADVYLDARNSLFIEIKQREPILRVIDQKGRQYYLDADGVHIPLSSSAVARVPVASGYIPPYFDSYLENEESILNHLYQLITYVREDDFLEALVEQIYVDRGEEFSIVPKVGHEKIILGDYVKIEDKFDRLKIFYKKGMPYKGFGKYKTLNLKFDNQVVGEK